MSSGTNENPPFGSSNQTIHSAENYETPRRHPVSFRKSHKENSRVGPPDVNPYLITVKQAAERLQLGVNCVYGLTKADHDPIPTVVIGRSIRIPVAALERWLEAQTRG